MAIALFFRGGCKPVLKGYKKLLTLQPGRFYEGVSAKGPLLH